MAPCTLSVNPVSRAPHFLHGLLVSGDTPKTQLSVRGLDHWHQPQKPLQDSHCIVLESLRVSWLPGLASPRSRRLRQSLRPLTEGLSLRSCSQKLVESCFCTALVNLKCVVRSDGPHFTGSTLKPQTLAVVVGTLTWFFLVCMASTLSTCPMSPEPRECLSPLARSLDHCASSRRHGSLVWALPLQVPLRIVSWPSRAPPRSRVSPISHSKVVAILPWFSRVDWPFPFSPDTARFTVLYTLDRRPKCPWLSRCVASAVLSFSLGEDGGLGASLRGWLSVGLSHPSRLLLASG